jgi:branched-chain amino acid transport system substrate-binding protein
VSRVHALAGTHSIRPTKERKDAMKRKLVVALALATSALLAVTACSSSKSKDNSGNSGTHGPKLTGAPILIGALGGYTGAQAGSTGLVDNASRVWEKWVNDNGGINGHPVKLFVEDEAGDPGKALQAAKKLVEVDHVIAIVGEHSLADEAWSKYVQEKGIPVIGGVPVQATMFSNPDFFPIGTNAVTGIVGQLIIAKQAGKKKFGVMYCAESPVCATLGGIIKAAAAIVGGIEVGPALKVAATQPSFTAECLTMKRAGVDALMTALAAPSVPRIMKGCATVGYKPTQDNQGTTTSVEWLSSPELEGALLTSPNAVFNDSSIPAVKVFLDAIKKYDPSMLKSPQFDVNTIWPWMAGLMFAKVAKLANLSPTSTPADVLTGLYQIKDETVDGLAPPVTYTKGQPTFVSCYFTQTIKGGKFVATNDGKTSCLTPAQVTGILKVLSGG